MKLHITLFISHNIYDLPKWKKSQLQTYKYLFVMLQKHAKGPILMTWFVNKINNKIMIVVIPNMPLTNLF